VRVEGQPAFVLHARAYRETSMLLEVLTREHGRLGLVARGVRRERTRLPRGQLQPLQPLLIGFVLRGELGTLTGAEPAATLPGPGGDALLAGIYVNELVLRMTGRADPHPRMFDAYAECVAALARRDIGGVRESAAGDSDVRRARDATGWTLRRFERDLLAELGYALPLRRVAGSGAAVGSASTYAYDPEAGPLETRVPGDSLRVRGSALLALADDVRPDAADLEQLRRLMRAVIRHHLGGANLNAWSLTSGVGGVGDR
jgi:DNA repair protein RecO (recombination protein O)